MIYMIYMIYIYDIYDIYDIYIYMYDISSNVVFSTGHSGKTMNRLIFFGGCFCCRSKTPSFFSRHLQGVRRKERCLAGTVAPLVGRRAPRAGAVDSCELWGSPDWVIHGGVRNFPYIPQPRSTKPWWSGNSTFHIGIIEVFSVWFWGDGISLILQSLSRGTQAY